MFKYLCKNILTQSKLNVQYSKNRNFFSSKLAAETQSLQDWQYVQLISKQIKSNNVNQAIKHLIQSHLNKQILNKQIYYTIQQKMQELALPISYQELLYKLYREHFQPNSLIIDWMKKISKTENTSLLQLLKKDYELLNQSYPLDTKNISPQQQLKSKANKIEKIEQEVKNSVGRKSRKVPTIPSTDEYFSKSSDAIYVTKRQHNKSQQHSQIKQQISEKPTIEADTVNEISNTLTNMFKQYGKVTLHNVELVLQEDNEDYDVDNEMNQMYDQGHVFQQEGQQQQTVQDYILQMLTSITKIKIGKIQFQNPSFLDQIKKLNPKNHNNTEKQ